MHLAGVVRVVVDEGDAAGPPRNWNRRATPAYRASAARHASNGDAELHRHRHRGRGVADVVQPGHRQVDLAERARRRGRSANVAPARSVRWSTMRTSASSLVPYSTAPCAAAELRGDRIVGAHDLAPGRVEEPVERRLDLGERAVVVEVVGFDVRDDDVLGRAARRTCRRSRRPRRRTSRRRPTPRRRRSRSPRRR